MPTYGLNKIFPPLYDQTKKEEAKSLCDALKNVLQTKNYPKDYDFRAKLKDAKLYGPGDRVTKTKLILEALDSAHGHKELVPYDKLTIEHVMPQSLSEGWKQHLGDDWQMVQELYLHTLGNLTLTAYNSELSNEAFSKKRKLLSESHIELNKAFSEINFRTETAIKQRAEQLADLAMRVWPYFGKDEGKKATNEIVTGKTPKALWILGQRYDVTSWRDVLGLTVDTIADLEPDGFARILAQFPRFVAKDDKKFRSARELKCGAFVEVNLGSESIYRFCSQAIESIELTSDDWRVETN